MDAPPPEPELSIAPPYLRSSYVERSFNNPGLKFPSLMPARNIGNNTLKWMRFP
jgi:hypothetical protein